MKQRLIHSTLVLVFLVSTFMSTLSVLLPQPHASADANDSAPPSADSIKNGKFTWWDRNTIHASINGKTYYFRANTENDTVYYKVGNSDCYGHIYFNNKLPFNYLNEGADANNTDGGNNQPGNFKPGEIPPKTINVDMDWKNPDVGGSSSNATCQSYSGGDGLWHGISITNDSSDQTFDTYFFVSDDGRSVISVDSKRTYTQDNTYKDLYYRDDESTCQDVIQVFADKHEYKSYELDSNGGGGAPPSATHSDPGCNIIDGTGLVQMDVFQTLGNSGALPTDANPGGGGGGAAGGAAGSTGVSCDLGISLSFGGVLNAINPLNWLLCGIVKGMNLIVTSLDAQINSMLVLGTGGSTSTDNPNNIFSDSNGCAAKNNECANYYTAWRAFRNIALGLLVIVGLIIVISQALGMEVLDAYTIRKMLPRVLIATIAVTISWQLMRFFVTVSNDLGYGIGYLLDAPFHGMGQNIKVGGANGLIGTFALALGGVFFDLFGMLAFVGTAAIAVLVTFLVLTLRQIAVILLIIFSPIAILSYVLPNTQRVYKFWWESFSKLLLMFPMIVAFITAGHIFSAISSDQGSGFVHQTIAFIAYFAPYFAVPMTFRFSGGLMSGIGNAINSNGLTNAARSGLSNFRSGRVKKNTAALGAGTRFEGKKWIPGSTTAAKGVARIGTGAAVGWKGRYGFGQRGKEALGQHLLTTVGELGKDHGMMSILGYNDANRILAEGMGDERLGRERLFQHLTKDGGDDGKTFLSPEKAQARVDKAAKAAKAAGAFTHAHGVAALNNMARDGTAIRDTDDLARLAAMAGEGDRNATFTTAASLASISRQAGRPDLAAASEPIGTLAFAYSDMMHHAPEGKGLLGGEHAAEGKLSDLSFEAWESGAGGESAYGALNSAKSRAIRFPAQYAMQVVKNEAGTYSVEQQQKAASFLMHTQNGVNSGYGRPNNIAQFRSIVGSPENERALDNFLSQPAEIKETTRTMRVADRQPQAETRTVQGTQREIVGKLVSERASMSEEQRAEMARQGNQQQEQEEQQG